MVELTDRAKYYYGVHGWSDSDIQYLVDNCDEILDHDGWAMGVATDPNGVKWLYPTSPGNVFPVSLWKKIKWYIENSPGVIIPQDSNLEKVAKAAKRYNGYLSNNLWLFGEELHNLIEFKGENRWHG